MLLSADLRFFYVVVVLIDELRSFVWFGFVLFGRLFGTSSARWIGPVCCVDSVSLGELLLLLFNVSR
jgi:hypothetical protein